MKDCSEEDGELCLTVCKTRLSCWARDKYFCSTKQPQYSMMQEMMSLKWCNSFCMQLYSVFRATPPAMVCDQIDRILVATSLALLLLVLPHLGSVLFCSRRRDRVVGSNLIKERIHSITLLLLCDQLLILFTNISWGFWRLDLWSAAIGAILLCVLLFSIISCKIPCFLFSFHSEHMIWSDFPLQEVLKRAVQSKTAN